MVQEWLVEILKGTSKVFLQPVFYYLFMIAAILGVSRVKRERGDFHVRVENAYFELRQVLPLGMLIGLLLSVITLGAGLVLPLETIVFTAVFTLLWSFTTRIRWMAPAYTLGFAFFATMFAAEQKWPLPAWLSSFSSTEEMIFPSIAVILGLLIIGEGILILRNGPKGSSPKLIKSKRGQRVGIHEVKRLWMLPLFLVVPGEALSAVSWWPIFTVGGEAYSILLVPFSVGFAQQIQGKLPIQAIQTTGKQVIKLGVFILLLSISGYWSSLASIAVVALAIIGREFLAFRQKVTDGNLPIYFSKRNHSVMILGIIPHSPAFHMGLKVGEQITKVNGVQVHDKEGLYEALLKNRAHCKLEVLDTKGEVRFVQRALFEGDHHELGILFVQDERKKANEAV